LPCARAEPCGRTHPRGRVGNRASPGRLVREPEPIPPRAGDTAARGDAANSAPSGHTPQVQRQPRPSSLTPHDASGTGVTVQVDEKAVPYFRAGKEMLHRLNRDGMKPRCCDCARAGRRSLNISGPDVTAASALPAAAAAASSPRWCGRTLVPAHCRCTRRLATRVWLRGVQPASASFTCFAGANPSLRDAAISIVSPVAGLRP